MNKQKVLFYDIETAPNLGYYFELYKEGNIIEVNTHWYILSFAWKWLGQKTTHVLSLKDFDLYKKDKENDRELIKKLWELFNEADIIVAHNGDNFDIKKSNARFIKHHLKPPSPYKQIDTKKVAKRYFKFDSNKLDDLGDYLGIGRKIQTGGKKLWLDCISGDLSAWRKMCSYNKQDVVLLEKVYNEMLPYMTNHPDLGFRGECTNCGSDNLYKEGQRKDRNGKIIQKFQCQNCGHWMNEKIK